MRWFTSVAAAACFVSTLGVAMEASASASARQWSSSLVETDIVYAPRGFQQLCASRPEFCVEAQTAGEITQMLGNLKRMYGKEHASIDAPELTKKRYEQMARVNLTVNHSIRPTEDRAGDVWSFSAMSGDCEEYVLMKREMLAALGWPRSAMRIGVVKGVRYPYHAVLIVSTKGGEFVLDNMTDEITTVRDSKYVFVVTQSSRMPGKWVRVHQSR